MKQISADVRWFYHLIKLDEVFGTHNGQTNDRAESARVQSRTKSRKGRSLTFLE